ncbi:4Fe-4S dicluster domain-containing protein [Kiritimatiellaeota bacterium B1221]|nr:4Fe-4S dicluster domain-containing protein [Kiritimatiellaeota bacterium B1221]
MNTDTPTSFGDQNGILDLRSMREVMKQDWEQRDRRMYSSYLDRDATQLPSPAPAARDEETDTGVNRRSFMKLMGGSAALAGLAACTRQPKELIVPYVKAPEEIIPGKPLFYATARMFGGYAQGIMVESHMGRPTKVEGNPLHPASLGGTDTFSQASVLDLYDPDRLSGHRKAGIPSDFNTFKKDLQQAMADTPSGKGLRVLLPHSSSVTEKRLCEKLLENLPEAQIHVFDPVSAENEALGLEKLFGKPMQSVLHLDKADVVVSFDSDFMGWSPAKVRYAKDFSSRRRIVDGAHRNRFYAVESTFSVTGSNADDRLPVRAGRVEGIARAVAAGLGMQTAAPELNEREAAFVKAMVSDLKKAGKKALVTVGPHQSAALHALGHLINVQLAAVGTTIEFIEPQLNGPVKVQEDFMNLVRDMHDGEVKVLAMLDVNPLYNAPLTLRFEKALENVAFSFQSGQLYDETARKCSWALSSTHYLETWSDMAAFDGTLSIAQPLIAPLYESKSPLELLSVIAGEEMSAFELVQETWKARTGLGDDEDGFNRFWRTTLHDGFIKGSAAKPWKGLKAKSEVLSEVYEDPQGEFGLEVVFQPDARVWDGQFANNPWLQEMPAPISTLTWDTVFTISPNTAKKYKIRLTNEGVQKRTVVKPKVQIIELNVDKRTLQGPVLVIPGHPDDTVMVTLGGGRQVGKVAKGVGYNAAALRTGAEPWIQQGATVLELNRFQELALTQDHFPLQADGRALIREAGLDQYKQVPDFPTQMVHQFSKKFTLYPEWDYSKGLQWGMVVDLNTCIGCNACMVACQAENNIPTVGKDEVMNGREMSWIRVDRYFEELDNGETRLHVMPMACVHCENAPCETVCPVGATMHSAEGLNMMVYNRCVGTRYCANNCPYKVRRFNFFKYTDEETESIKLQRNPDVTVRLRGVMEKCTYCVQRLNLARIDSKVNDRPFKDGDVVTACQQACPTEAITFGNIIDPNSKVAQLKASGLNYTILEPLNTRARTSFLGKVRNPNPELEPSILKPLTFKHGPGGAHGEHAAPEGHAAPHGSDKTPAGKPYPEMKGH